MKEKIRTEKSAVSGEYSLLGRSGLAVSPLCLGTMTFGTEWGWGTDAATSRAVFDRYVASGGNFIDTADGYTNGTSETLLGQFMRAAGNRDRLVVATKFTFNAHTGDPNAGGNSRKNIYRALESSLRRLQTDYVDLYWMHAWDSQTPVDEVLYTLDSLVKAGKVRYIGLSDTPAWYAARAQTLAELKSWAPVCALQLEYSLVERNIEREHIPAALELGWGVCPWSPLAGGFLAGKYRQEKGGTSGAGRLDPTKGPGNPYFQRFTERNWRILDALTEVSKEADRRPAQVALNWITRRPGVASTIIGATSVAQLEDNLRALDFVLPHQASEKLEAASRPEAVFPYTFFGPPMQGMVRGGASVRREPPWFRECQCHG